MRQVLNSAASFLSVGLLAVLTFGMHAGTLMPQTNHAMGSASHGTSSSTSCITVCTLSALQKDEYLSEITDENDDEPQLPFYMQLQSSPLAALEKKHEQETHTAINQEPPPGGMPAYISFGVFRV